MSEALKPGYKQTEVGMIPHDWEVKVVTDVCGFIVPGRNKPKSFDGDIPWITTPDLTTGQGIKRSRRELKISASEAKDIGSKIVPTGSILMSCVGELGIIALTECDLVINQQLHAFIPSEKVLNKFLLHVLATKREYLYEIATKTTIPYLNKENCNSIKIQLPSLGEQESIALALSDMDTLISNLDQLITKKRNIQQAAMQQLLTGQYRLPGFSEEWDMKRLGEIFSISTGKSKSPHTTPYGNYWVVDMGSVSIEGKLIVSKRTDFGADFLNSGDLVMPKDDIGGGGIIGRAGYIDADDTYVLSDHVYRLQANFGNPLFLSFAINGYKINSALRKKVIGSAQLGLSRKSVEEQEISLPSFEEQTAIATILSDMDTELADLEARRDKAQQLKQGMMQELLTGRIRLTNQGV